MKTQMPARKRIALVAHDGCKPQLMEWAQRHADALAQHELYATGTTAERLAGALKLPIQAFLSGPMGGDQQIGARIAEGELDILVFFWDPMSQQPHDPDIKALLRIAAVWNVPVACNAASADFMFASPLLAQPYPREVLDYAAYQASRR
ncbi:MAG: methylglyoxal synthase [Litorivicinus sp.]